MPSMNTLPNTNTADSAAVSPASSWPLDAFGQDPGYLAYQEELQCLIFRTAQTAAPTRQNSPVPEIDVSPDEDVAAQEQKTKDVLSNPQRRQYLVNYVAEVAPWLDMFDSQRVFTVQLPLLARRCPALLYAILALSARQTERKEGKQHSFDSLELYQETIRLLNPLLEAHDLVVVPICVILCCLEMLSASPRDWRRHLEGCAALFDAFGVNGFSGGLLQAVFWCYARMDLCGALISNGIEATLVPTHKWLPPHTTTSSSSVGGGGGGGGASPASPNTDAVTVPASVVFREHRSPDMHANYAVYLCSEVCRLIADRTRYTELDEQNGCDARAFQARWLHLWSEVQAWLRDRPQELVPVQTIESQPFPQILFVHWAGISSNQLYHTACIVLLGAKPQDVDRHSPNGLASSSSSSSSSSPGSSPVTSATWHAKRVCGISLTNPHQGCLNNAIQPLWVAGQLLSHKSEHDVLVKLIRSIESMTGWATSWRIADLETAWGYKIRC